MNPIFPLLYAGPVDYYAALLHFGQVTFDRHEHYPKQTLRNRCVIYGANGPLSLSIPVQRSGEKTTTEQAKIANAERWQLLHWRSFEAAYRSSPFFEFFEDDLRVFYTTPQTSLLAFTSQLHTYLLRALQLNIPYTFSSAFEVNNPAGTEFRALFGKTTPSLFTPVPYYQVFEPKHGFVPHLSIFDLLFNLGNMAGPYLKKMAATYVANDQ